MLSIILSYDTREICFNPEVLIIIQKISLKLKYSEHLSLPSHSSQNSWQVWLVNFCYLYIRFYINPGTLKFVLFHSSSKVIPEVL